MARVLVLVADGSEEIETVTVVNVLRRAGIEVVLASVGVDSGMISGSRKIRMVADARLEVMGEETRRFDMVVVPGGVGGVDVLCGSQAVLELVRFYAESGSVAAICAGPLVLANARVMGGYRVTGYPSLQEKLKEVFEYQCARCVVDRNLVTGSGPGTSLEFALAIVERMADKETRDRVASSMLY